MLTTYVLDYGTPLASNQIERQYNVIGRTNSIKGGNGIMKRHLIFFLLLLSVVIIFAIGDAKAQRRGEHRDRDNSRWQQTYDRGRHRGWDNDRHRYRSNNYRRYGYRNYGQYRRTQVGNRRNGYTRSYYWWYRRGQNRHYRRNY